MAILDPQENYNPKLGLKNIYTKLVEIIKQVNTNVTNIATNATNIASNTSAIESLEGLSFNYSVVEISSAQILALATTPVTLISALGATKIIAIDKCIGVYNNVTTGYTAGLGSTFDIYYSGGDPIIPSAAFIQNSNDEYRHNALFATVNCPPNTDIILDNTGAAYTGGDGTVTLHIYYTIIDIA